MNLVNSPEAPAAVGPYSHAVRTGNLLFCSGQIPLDPSEAKVLAQDIDSQTTQVFENIRAVLATAGLGLADVVKTTVFLSDMENFKSMNTVYAAEFKDHKPARSTVEVARLPLDVLVEIEVIAEIE